MVVTERQSALTDVIQAINSTLELNEVLRIVMDNIIRLMKAERGFLMLRDENGELVTHIARNWEQESLELIRVRSQPDDHPTGCIRRSTSPYHQRQRRPPFR